MELRTELEIEAPPERVWAVLTDFSAYHEWNPFITSIQGNLGVGEKLAVTISPPEGRDWSFRPSLVVCEAPRELRWLGHLWFKGLFDGEHFFQCNEAASGRTRFVHGENLKGFLVKYAGPMMTKVTRGFVYMNQALKKRVEGRSGS
jgi:hypothetical protein